MPVLKIKGDMMIKVNMWTKFIWATILLLLRLCYTSGPLIVKLTGSGSERSLVRYQGLVKSRSEK